jgi:hypothetical protein
VLFFFTLFQPLKKWQAPSAASPTPLGAFAIHDTRKGKLANIF